MSEIEVPEMYKKHQEWLAQTGGPAYPGGVNSVYTHLDAGEPTNPGMTLRDWFAGQASAGAAADAKYSWGKNCKDGAAWCAAWCYEVADAMLAERDKEAR